MHPPVHVVSVAQASEDGELVGVDALQTAAALGPELCSIATEESSSPISSSATSCARSGRCRA